MMRLPHRHRTKQNKKLIKKTIVSICCWWEEICFLYSYLCILSFIFWLREGAGSAADLTKLWTVWRCWWISWSSPRSRGVADTSKIRCLHCETLNVGGIHGRGRTTNQHPRTCCCIVFSSILKKVHFYQIVSKGKRTFPHATGLLVCACSFAQITRSRRQRHVRVIPRPRLLGFIAVLLRVAERKTILNRRTICFVLLSYSMLCLFCLLLLIYTFSLFFFVFANS